MHDDVKDQALREAGMHLTKAMQALHSVEAYGLASETFTLANRVLKARQSLRAPARPAEAAAV